MYISISIYLPIYRERERERKIDIDTYWQILFFFFFFFFPTLMWKFPSQVSNPRHCCHLSHNSGSPICCATRTLHMQTNLEQLMVKFSQFFHQVSLTFNLSFLKMPKELTWHQRGNYMVVNIQFTIKKSGEIKKH